MKASEVLAFISVVIALVFGFIWGYMAAKERVRDDCLAIQKTKASNYEFRCEVIK